jgi:hypothetical protein
VKAINENVSDNYLDIFIHTEKDGVIYRTSKEKDDKRSPIVMHVTSNQYKALMNAVENEKLKAENKRLREALKVIATEVIDDGCGAVYVASEALKDGLRCKTCAKEKTLCSHGYCAVCQCKDYCWID